MSKSRSLVQNEKHTPPPINHLLVIGIDEYEHLPNLFNAVRDAKAFVEVLCSKYEFDRSLTQTLFNHSATRRNITLALSQYVRKLTDRDNIVIYFSGHGYFERELNEGYWIPSDGELGHTDSYLSNQRIATYLNAIKSNHIFLVVDSCFSGALFKERYTYQPILDEKIPSRWALTSGRMEPVMDGKPGDHSPFADNILFFLKNNQKERFSILQLVENVKQGTAFNAEQIPRGEPLQGVGHKGGVFFFRLKSNEESDWTAAQASNTIDSYQTFIQKYPASTHQEQAKAQLHHLEEIKAWKQVSKENSIKGYQQFVLAFPQSPNLAFAQKRLHVLKEKQAWEIANAQKTPEAFLQFRRDFPNSPNAAKALELINILEEEKLWRKALRRDTIVAYEKYLDKYPMGKYANDAHNFIEYLIKDFENSTGGTLADKDNLPTEEIKAIDPPQERQNPKITINRDARQSNGILTSRAFSWKGIMDQILKIKSFLPNRQRLFLRLIWILGLPFGILLLMNWAVNQFKIFEVLTEGRIEFREDYDNLKEQVDGVEKALNVRGIGLQDSINVLSELGSGKIRGEWERRVKDSSLVGWVDLGKQIDNVRKRYNLLARVRKGLNIQMDKLCKDYHLQVETAGGPDVIVDDLALRMTVEGIKEDFEKICNRVHGMDKAKEECSKKCPLMYTNGSSGTTSDSEEKTTSSITDEDEDDLGDQSGSLTYYGIDLKGEYWKDFKQVIFIGDNCFKALYEKTNKWGIYPREEINGKRYFFSSKNESVAFDEVSKYHNGVVKAIRGNEHYFITNKGRLIEAKVNEGEPKIRFSWVEQEFGSTCPGYGGAVIMGTSDTIYISKSGVYRQTPPCSN